MIYQGRRIAEGIKQALKVKRAREATYSTTHVSFTAPPIILRLPTTPQSTSQKYLHCHNPQHIAIPPPPLPLTPTHNPRSANLRLVSTNRCLPLRVPSTSAPPQHIHPIRSWFHPESHGHKRDERTGDRVVS